MLASKGNSGLATVGAALQRRHLFATCRRYFLLLLCMPLLAVMTACSTGGNDDDDPVVAESQAPFPFKALEVTPPADTAAIGTTVQFVATGIKDDDSTENLTTRVIWSAEDESVAQIDAVGVATGIAPGKTIINAEYTSDGRTLRRAAGMTVNDEGLVSISVVAAETNIAAGTSTALTATGSFSDGSTQDISGLVSWQSSDEGVVTIDTGNPSDVRANGIADGGAEITATLDGQSDSVSITVSEAVLESIAVTPARETVVAGMQQQFTATGTFSDGRTQQLNATVNWESSNTSVASIGDGAGSGGLARALAAGETNISATLNGISGRAVLTVTDAELVSIAVTPAAPSVAAGTQLQFTAVGTFSDEVTRELTGAAIWASSNETVSSIANADGQEGLATTNEQGTTTISATVDGISGSTELTVGEQTLVSIDVTPTNPTIVVGTTQQFTATGNYSNNRTQDLTNDVDWQSSNTAVANIDAAGLATTDNAGSSEIAAAFNGISGSTTLTVAEAELTALEIQPDAPSITLGDQRQLTAIGSFSNGTTQDLTTSVTWTPTSSEIASVSNADGSKGLATAQGLGSVTVSATSGEISDETVVTVTDRVLESLIVTPADSTLEIGGQRQFTATGNYSAGEPEDLTDAVDWTSSNIEVASIDNADGRKGLAAAVGAGTTTIQASLDGIEGSTELTVNAATLESIQVSPQSATVADGETQQFQATGSFSNGDDRDITAEVTWAATNSDVAGISNADGSQGLATATAVGESTITATSGDLQGNATLTVDVARLTGITITAPSDIIDVGAEQQYTATGTFTNNSTSDLTGSVAWSSSNDNIASIFSGGLALGNSVGTVTISASFEGLQGDRNLEVREPDIEEPTLLRIEIAPLEQAINIGDTLQYSATAFFSDETSDDRTGAASWSSSNENIASISDDPADSRGLARGNSAGSVNIMATLEGLEAETSLEVRPDIVEATLTAIEISPQNETINVGEEQPFTLTGIYSDESRETIAASSASWRSSNPDVAQFDNSDGRAVGNSDGEVTVTAEFGGFEDQATLTVVDPVVIPTLERLEIRPQNATIERDGEPRQFTAVAFFSDDSSADRTNEASWSSSNENIASISDDPAASRGLANGNGVGTVTITATLDGVSAETGLEVVEPEPEPPTLTGITLSPLNAAIEVGETRQFTATANFSDNSSDDIANGDVSWSSSDPDIADFGNTAGEAIGNSPGTVSITGNYQGVSGEATLQVNAPERTLTGIRIAPRDASINVGENQQFTLAGVYSNDTTEIINDPAIDWDSSNTDVIEFIDSEGLATGNGAGSAVIRAVYQDFEDSTDINVNAVGPDLVVTSLRATGEPLINNDGGVNLPISVTVRNQGNAAADIFKVSVDYTTPEGRTFVVAFTVPGENSSFYPFTNDSLAAGDEVSFDGTLVFGRSVLGSTVAVSALADSCSGEEFVDDFCRIDETNEGNNRSSAIQVEIPAVELESVSIRLNGENIETFTMTEGDTADFSAVGRFNDGSERAITGDVEWRSSDTDVATVNNDAVVEAIRRGDAEITATYRPNGENLSDSVSVTVQTLLF